jgi:hypothetical protein
MWKNFSQKERSYMYINDDIYVGDVWTKASSGAYDEKKIPT